MNIAIVAEKPSVARDIAQVVGARTRGEGFLHGGGYVVTWAIGHLVQLAEPNEMKPEWRAWRRDTLPMLPRDWPLVVGEQTADQYEVVRKILTSPKIGEVVCATDAGREGELIFRYIYEAAQCDKPVRRLWISSLTADAIRDGLAAMKPGADYDPLADAARGRSRADWLVGMNLSRAYTLALGENFSVGRVQTPTLAMLVARELEIRAFVPEDYIEVVATFETPAKASYKGNWFRVGPEAPRDSMRLAPDGAEADAIVARAKTGTAAIESVKGETQRLVPPFLYDLTELQRHANRLYGFSAQKTLEVAQALYEKHKLLSYPRTDSRHLSTDVAKTLPRVVNAFSHIYKEQLAPGTGTRPLGKRYVDDTKVTDHHAIIPTATTPNLDALSVDERRIYDMVCRRLLQAWHDDHLYRITTVITVIVNGEIADKYHSSGTAVEQTGWKVLDVVPERAKGKKEAAEETLPSALADGLPVTVLDAEAQRKKTRPPKRFTEGTLLTAMESAGKTLDDKELSDAMKECGLGTPATRASIIEVLLNRGYAEREGKSLVATDKGIHLIEVVHEEVKSPIMTGQWEAHLQRIHRGKAELTPFMQGIEEYVTNVVGRALNTVAPAPKIVVNQLDPLPPKRESAGQPMEQILRDRFGFDGFRPGQEEICRAVLEGQDSLVVMPTGAGKSLCFQLPGLARGGTTLVVSPLIALMEDQVAKLRSQGIRAERLHSGLTRPASREICQQYLRGELDFLYVAPERFRVPNFPEMLAKRTPALVAIDEAHCISQWGHDFRPDYRRIGPYLEAFRPAPVIALTATATPRVQHDIVAQLGLDARRFIQGFWRDNIAIEVVEANPSRRADIAIELLSSEERRPAIVYAPSRKDTETVASAFNAAGLKAGAYHAGLDKDRRSTVQSRFLGGELDIIVATIAFGMGIDKPNVRTVIHMATPAAMENYYQEIGRAGRDGEPSRAILLQGYVDRRTHDFFFERDYPDPAEVARLFNRLFKTPEPKEALADRCRDIPSFDMALDKLWTYGGAEIDAEENVAQGSTAWREDYEAQREDKAEQLENMLRFATCNQCRMATLVRHFGDAKAARGRCGICDFCAPEQCIGKTVRPPTAAERRTAHSIIRALRTNSLSTGKLHTEIGGERRVFESVLGALASANFVRLEDTSFEKDGKTIAFRRAHLTPDGHRLGDEDPDFAITDVAAESAAPSKTERRTAAKAKKKAAAPVDAGTEEREKRLKAWRLAEARKQGVPAFRILTDAVVRAIATERPSSNAELLEVHGMGPRGVEKYGAAVLKAIQ